QLRHAGGTSRRQRIDGRGVHSRNGEGEERTVHGVRSQWQRSAGAVRLRAVVLALPLAAGGAFFWGPTPEALREPAVVASHDGVLQLTLTAARGATQVGGRRVIAQVY